MGMGCHTVVRLAIGLSKTPKLKFAWGAPVDAITVGMRSNWAVLADKLLDLHLHLGFDGEHLLVALAAPDALVYVNGNQIHGQQWWPVDAPGEIRAGSAVFKVETEGPDTVPLALNQQTGEPIETVYDGGMLRERGRVLLHQRVVSEPPAAGPGPQLALLPTMLSASHERPAPVAVPAPLPVVAAPAAAQPPVPMQPAVPMQRPLASPPDLSAAVTVFGPSNEPVAPASPPSAPPVDLPIDVELELLGKKRDFWRQASAPKKAIALLLPLALGAMLYDSNLLSGEVAAPPVRPAAVTKVTETKAATSPVTPAVAMPPAPSTAALPAASAEALAPRLAALPAAPASAESKPPPTSSAAAAPATVASSSISARPGANGALPPDRAAKAALDLAFIGNLKEASRVYGELAAANPEQRAFALAARMTAERAVQHP